MRRFLVYVLLALIVSPSAARQSVRHHTNRQPPVIDSSASLPRSTPERQGISSSDILDFVDTADKQIDTMNSFMLVRHGYVVAKVGGVHTIEIRHTSCIR